VRDGLAVVFGRPRLTAQESPYFIAYSHHLEEPGALEIALIPMFATQPAATTSWRLLEIE